MNGSVALQRDALAIGGGEEARREQRGEAEKMRDRLWTLLVRRYADLRKIAYYFHGDAFEDVTPKLLSRLSSCAAEDESEEVEAEDDGSEDADGGGSGGAVEQPASPSSP
ncbi:hypothetical protein BE21_55130 [Sorangium cellulosum]|uniref:Uncharacterized protein n=1 Tax=Sorangium cellulosum TaxID=56 RepID=A0A150TCB6_SORCE|nr:hypothetical protein BE21_55130 [Sorangium cellulosum]